MPERMLCASEALIDGGDGVRFKLEWQGREEPAFVVRHNGVVRGYLNRCAHVPSELDWMEGKFFDTEGSALICSIHGATYAPDTGRCLGGPCQSRGLVPVPVEERDGFVFLRDPQAKDNSNE
jgi:nitrite reductase/ring-hydroxylating ferredoxin subunit